MGKFATSADETRRSDDERTAVIELERAGVTNAAAETDIGVADATRQIDAGRATVICIAKAEL